jgi:hypothetical protein
VKAKTLLLPAAVMVALTVVLAGGESPARAQPVASISLPPPGATKQLYSGCNNITLTFADGTSSGGLIEATNPPGVAEAVWRHDAAGQRWEAYSPTTSQVSDLLTVNFLDAVWLCLPAPVPAPTAPPVATDGQVPLPPDATMAGSSGDLAPTSESTETPPAADGGGPSASGAVSTVLAPTSALGSFRYSAQISVEVEGETLTLRSSGAFEAPDSMSCVVSGSAGGFTFDMGKLVIIGNSAWLDLGSGWAPAGTSDPGVVDNLELCPSSAVFWQNLGLPGDLGGIQGPVMMVNGVEAVRVSVAGLVQSLPGLGIIPSGLEGATVRTFDMWVAQDGGWVVAAALDAAFSDEEGDARIQMRVDVTSPNDQSISVVPPI